MWNDINIKILYKQICKIHDNLVLYSNNKKIYEIIDDNKKNI